MGIRIFAPNLLATQLAHLWFNAEKIFSNVPKVAGLECLTVQAGGKGGSLYLERYFTNPPSKLESPRIDSRNLSTVLSLFGSKFASFKYQCDDSTVCPSSSYIASNKALRKSDSIRSRLQNIDLRIPLSKSMANFKCRIVGRLCAKSANFFVASK